MNDRFVLKPIKRVATINDEALGETTDPDFELQYIDIGNVDSNGDVHEIAAYRFEDAPSRARRIVRDGDVIISTVRTYLQAITPINDPPENLIVSTGFAVVRPSAGKLDASFCKYALREPRFIQEVITRSTGVSYPAITSLGLADIPIFVPPLSEQHAIAEFLDRETARLDTLIVTKERLLELLDEKRNTLVSQAVTNGINPAVKMKDSGVAWLGQVPNHWEMKPYKFIATRVDVGIAEAATHAYADSGVPIIRTTNVKPNQILTDDILYIEQWFADKNESKYLYAGDIVTVRTGKPGTSAVVPQNLDKSQCFTMLTSSLKKNHLPQFYSYYFNAKPAQMMFWLEGWGTAQKNISVPILKQLLVLIPPYDEQKEIVAFIEKTTGKLDELINKVETAIALLRERRASLIAEAVSGQIKVV